MQPQFILATLLAGLVAAAPQDIVFPDAEDDGCEQGKAITGPPGTFCIGTHGENYGPPKTAATECGIPACFKFPGCEKYVKGPDGCDECPPGC
ncbi:hypothetical protein LMH87_002567 [Akanthomyces muscarius]|uniref:Uncharacterized protein n=2 Tax=Akanthomyces TaxID=150366 RepID=A0A168FUA9_CORDF|nr:hypothetical protein LMH87_002567 [Akanthomyces muscarius]KAJ4148079.1 hypothetical protein LMH87_002567 [Akanthomyces muscarius]OAA75627.1 hypothetical protein LEL_07615 [Akanthomyces lecanii RCEF 1005]